MSDKGEKSLAIHEYPYRAGGEVEDLGRKPRIIPLKAVFWGVNYLSGLRALIKAFEEEGKGELVHPVFGSVEVVIRNWDVPHEAERPDYATVSFEAVEASPDIDSSAGAKNNVISLEMEESCNRRHSEVTVLGQSTGGEDDEAQNALRATVKDGGAWFYRPLIRDEGHVDSVAMARTRARKVITDGVFDSLTFTAVVHGLVNGAIIKGSQCTHGSAMSSSNYGKGYALGIDASKSNDVYGASSTVMPPSVDIPVILYLGRPK